MPDAPKSPRESTVESGCLSCGEDDLRCPSSKAPCGHHCNHSWTHDECDWCGMSWGEGGRGMQRVVHLPSGRKGRIELPVNDLVRVEWDEGWTSRPFDHMDLRTMPDGRRV